MPFLPARPSQRRSSIRYLAVRVAHFFALLPDECRLIADLSFFPDEEEGVLLPGFQGIVLGSVSSYIFSAAYQLLHIKALHDFPVLELASISHLGGRKTASQSEMQRLRGFSIAHRIQHLKDGAVIRTSLVLDGCFFLASKQATAAVTCLENALAISADAQVYCILGQAQHLSKDYSAAFASYERAIALGAQDVFEQAGVCALDTCRFDEAEKYLMKALRTNTNEDPSSILALLLTVYHRDELSENQTQKIRGLMEFVRSMDCQSHSSSTLAKALADVLIARPSSSLDVKAAQEYLRQVLDIDPDDRNAQEKMKESVFLLSNKHALLLRTLDTAFASIEKTPSLAFSRAGPIESIFRLHLAEEPGDHAIRIEYGNFLWSCSDFRGNLAEARSFLEEAVLQFEQTFPADVQTCDNVQLSAATKWAVGKVCLEHLHPKDAAVFLTSLSSPWLEKNLARASVNRDDDAWSLPENASGYIQCIDALIPMLLQTDDVLTGFDQVLDFLPYVVLIMLSWKDDVLFDFQFHVHYHISRTIKERAANSAQVLSNFLMRAGARMSEMFSFIPPEQKSGPHFETLFALHEGLFFGKVDTATSRLQAVIHELTHQRSHSVGSTTQLLIRFLEATGTHNELQVELICNSFEIAESDALHDYYFHGGPFSRAKTLYSSRVPRYKTFADNSLAVAMFYCQSDPEIAIPYFKSYLAVEAEDVVFRVLLGQTLLNSGRPEDAKSELLRCKPQDDREQSAVDTLLARCQC